MLGNKLRQKEGMLGEMTPDQLVLVQLALELAFELLLELGLKPVSYTHLTLPTICSV